ncbi:hypothetical protein FACS1894219_10450 [Clostridia bacterium]|nr:hypothetical protein FACS1894219_10450 [Clostridia bacterium]
MKNIAKTSPLLSVIVPMYDIEPYIERCVKSILAQTFSDFELILVNDGSPAGEGKVVKQFTKSDDRVRYLYHEENQGLFKARMTGIRAANGKYIAFVDGDDYVSVDWFRMLVQKAEETQSDITIGDWCWEYEDGRKAYPNLDEVRVRDFVLEKGEIIDNYMRQEMRCYSWHVVWNKIYSRRLFVDAMPLFEKFALSCGNHTMCEDVVYSGVLWCLAEHVANTHGAYYWYFQRTTRSTNTDSIEKFEKNITQASLSFEFFKSVLKETGYFGKYKRMYMYMYMYMYMHYVYHITAKNLPESDRDNALVLVKDKLGENCIFLETNYGELKEPFYLSQTNLSQTNLWYEDIKKAIINPKTKIVSFDIFDTLTLRPFFQPTDIFIILEDEAIKLTGATSWFPFVDVRNCAETLARKYQKIENPKCEDITLDQVYGVIEKHYMFPHEICQKLMQKEIEYEIKFTSQRAIGKELFDLAKHLGKKIILTSDMYLPSDTIEKIVKKCGYTNWDKLYLSCEVGKGKYTGNLFRHIIAEEDTDPNEIVHVGDNWGSDVETPRKLGMQAYHLSKPMDMFQGLNPGIWSGEHYKKVFSHGMGVMDFACTKDGYIGLRTMLGMCANKLNDNPYMSYNPASDVNCNPYSLGYYCLGMYTYAVADWVLDRAKTKNAQTIHFVARDGYLFREAYDIITRDMPDAPKSAYTYISRKAIILADVKNKTDLYSLHRKLYVHKISPKKLVDILKVSVPKEKQAEVPSWLKANNYNPDIIFEGFSDFDIFLKKFAERFIDENLLCLAASAAKMYLSKNIHEGDILFDIGYSGRAESAIKALLGFSVDSLYLHKNGSPFEDRARYNGSSNEQFYPYKPHMTGYLREHLSMKLAPSTIGYEIKDGEAVPVFEKYRSNYPNDYITDIAQNAAIDFVRDFTDTFGDIKHLLPYRYFDAVQPFEAFLHYPASFDQLMFANLVFEDDMGIGHREILDWWNEDLNRVKPIERVVERVVIQQTEINSAKSDLVSSEISEELKRRDQSIEELRVSLHTALNSWTWKIGRIFVGFPGFVKRKIFRRK